MVLANLLPDYAMTLEDDQAVFWRRAGEGTSVTYKPQTAQAEPAATEPQSSSAERRITISEWAMERLYELAPRLDKYMLERAYIAWAKDKDPARDEDARFLGWVKSYTKNKPSP